MIIDANSIIALHDAGLIQFGRFIQADGAVMPLRLNLGLLPAYPAVLQALVDTLCASVSVGGYDRIVCDMESLPLGVLLSQRLSIPLVYSRGKGENAVYDLVGAYDIGHPVLLLLNVLDDAHKIAQLRDACRSVGLNVSHTLGVIGIKPLAQTQALYVIEQIATTLTEAQRLPHAQAVYLLDWARAL